MTWVQAQLDDENIFPSKIGTWNLFLFWLFPVVCFALRSSHPSSRSPPPLGVPFPKEFHKVVRTILKRLFRVYAHIYHSHFNEIVALEQEAHLNTSFKHFVLFVQEFDLIDRKDLAPLAQLIETLTKM